MKNKRIGKTKLNMKKIILAIAVIILLVISIIILMGGTTSSHTEIALKTVYVAYGETLWEIARVEAKNNEYYAKQDIRSIVKDIKEINHLESCNLYMGQSLLIPSL